MLLNVQSSRCMCVSVLLFIYFPFCLQKPQEDQLAESSSTEQGVALQKQMWASLCLSFILSLPLVHVIIRTAVARFTAEQPVFVKYGNNSHSQLVEVKWDGMSFWLKRDGWLIKDESSASMARRQALQPRLATRSTHYFMTFITWPVAKNEGTFLVNFLKGSNTFPREFKFSNFVNPPLPTSVPGLKRRGLHYARAYRNFF